jgi:hypothetical protein
LRCFSRCETTDLRLFSKICLFPYLPEGLRRCPFLFGFLSLSTSRGCDSTSGPAINHLNFSKNQSIDRRTRADVLILSPPKTHSSATKETTVLCRNSDPYHFSIQFAFVYSPIRCYLPDINSQLYFNDDSEFCTNLHILKRPNFQYLTQFHTKHV